MTSSSYRLFVLCLAINLSGLAGAQTSAPAHSAQPTPGITVNADRFEDYYRSATLDSIGPLGSEPLLDIPYSVSVLPFELIENSQAVNFKDVSKYLPLVAYQEQQGAEILRPQTRGLQGGNFQNSRLDGMTMFVTVATAMEQFQQIEVVNGPSASLYGPANPSGMFNFVSKRPTDNNFREASVTYNSNSIGTAHLDVGGRFDANGVVSCRFNGLFGEGDGFVDDSHQRRALGDLGVDIRPWAATVLELNFTDYRLTEQGYPGWFTYGEKIKLPSAPDPDRVGFNQRYLGIDMKTQTSVARLKHELASNWHIVAGVLNQDATRNINTQVNNLTSNAGAYTSSMGSTFAPRFVISSDTGYLNGTFETVGIGHDLTVGTAGYRASSYSLLNPPAAARLRLGGASIDSPSEYPYPSAGVVDSNQNFDSSDTYQQGINVNDSLRFNPHWGARFGISQDWFHVNNFNNTGASTTRYANHGASPTASLLFKPRATQTAYITFASSLQAGDLAPGATVNAGTSLAPYRSKQYEVGYKATFARLDFSAALFRVERPFANIDSSDNVFKISGEQINKGLEVSVVGDIVNGLRVYGGASLLNARLEDTPLLASNDKTYVGAPKVKGNVLFEYQLPAAPEVVLIFNYQFTGPRAGNDTNTLVVAGYNVFDVGVRYGAAMGSLPVTYRLTLDNIADRGYWSTVGPSNLTGANTGNLLAHLGSPRTLLASASVHF